MKIAANYWISFLNKKGVMRVFSQLELRRKFLITPGVPRSPATLLLNIVFALASGAYTENH